MAPVLKAYLIVNITVALAWLLHRASTALTRSVDAAARLRFARALLGLALLSPLVFSALPRHYLPAINTVLPLALDGMSFSKRAGTAAPGGHPARESRAAVQEAPAGPRGADWVERLLSGNTALGLFLAGLAAACALLAWRWCCLGSLLGRAHPLHRLGRVQVAVSDEVTVPFSAWRWNGAWVVLSSDVVARPADFQVALRHEIQHHRQGDTLWTLAVEAIAAVLYLNPFMIRWRSELAELQEFSCDAALVGRRKVASHDYGSCLVRVAEAALGNRSILFGTTGMATDSGTRNVSNRSLEGE